LRAYLFWQRPQPGVEREEYEEGWGGIYGSGQGPRSIPVEATWKHKPRGQSNREFLARIEEQVPVWQRQMVLGPAPEFCIGAGGPPRRSVVPLSSMT